MDKFKERWDESYTNADNFIFYPDYNVIWFVTKFIKRRIGLDEYNYIKHFNTALDLGCGIGANLKFLDEYGFDVYGIDLSEIAIDFAKKQFNYERVNLSQKLLQASVESLPFENEKFDFVISNGVLDSMPLETAQKGFAETYRVLRDGGLFYVSLICADGVTYPPEFSGEVLIKDDHEKGTIQLYYNWTLINEMIEDKFKVLECKLTTEKWYVRRSINKRYSLVLKKINF